MPLLGGSGHPGRRLLWAGLDASHRSGAICYLEKAERAILEFLSMGDAPGHLKARMRCTDSEEGGPLARWSWDFALLQLGAYTVGSSGLDTVYLIVSVSPEYTARVAVTLASTYTRALDSGYFVL